MNNRDRFIKTALSLVLAFAMTFAPILSSYAVIATAYAGEPAGAEENTGDMIDNNEDLPYVDQTEEGNSYDQTITEEELTAEETNADEEQSDQADNADDSSAADKSDEEADTEKEESVAAEKTDYVWEDGKIRVTAVLDDPNAVPDDAKLTAAPIDKGSDNYDYEAYMDALNNGSDFSYDENNTLLYDISFIKDGIELQPASGKVSVTFEFLDSQLSEALGARKASDVNVIHLPLTEKVKEKCDTTADAGNISADDINVEKVTKADNELAVSIKNEKVKFELESFSGVAFSVPDEEQSKAYIVDTKYLDPNGAEIDSANVGDYYILVKQDSKYFYTKIGADNNHSVIENFSDNTPYDPDKEHVVSVIKSNQSWTTEIYDWMIPGGQYDTVEVGSALGDYILESIKSTDGKTVVTIKQKANYSVTVNLYDFDGLTPYTDGVAEGNYYIRIKATDNETGEEYYAVKPIELNGTSTATIHISGFIKLNDITSDADRGYNGTTPDEYLYDPSKYTIEKSDVRLITGNNINSDKAAFTADDTVKGFIFKGNSQDAQNHHSTISLRKVDTKYDVRIFFNPEGTDISADDHYYLFIEVTHQTSVDSYYLAPIAVKASELEQDENGYYYYDINVPNWMNSDGRETSDSFTGNEKNISVHILRADKALNMSEAINSNHNEKLTDGQFVKSYEINYGPRIKVENPEQKAVYYCDTINLIKRNATSDYDFRSILGPGVSYGITADKLHPKGSDIQSNFAANYFEGDNSVNPNLSGKYAGAISIANFVDFDDSDADGSYVIPGYTLDPSGQINIEQKGINAPIIVYTDSENRIEGKESRPLVQVVETPPDDVTDNIVEPIIEHMKSVSTQLAAHTPNASVVRLISNQVTVDASDYPDGATIYVDGDALYEKYGDIITGDADKLKIRKRENQTVVFNFTKTEELTISQFAAEIIKEDGSVISGNTSPSTTQSEQNKLLDNIARSVVWNLASVKKTTFKSPAGIFLNPNPDSYSITTGTTTGWLVTDGYFTTGSGEWHYVYADLDNVDVANLYAQKQINGNDAGADQKFEFKLEKLTDGSFREVEKKQNNGATVNFRVENLDDGWNVYKITETRVVDAIGDFDDNTQEFYAAVKYITVNGVKIADTPKYFTGFDINSFDPDSEELTGFSGPVESGRPAFTNTVNSGNLTLEKKVVGSLDHEDEFEFTIVCTYKRGLLSEEKRLIGIYNAVISEPGKEDINTSVEFKYGTANVKLKADQKIKILNIPAGVKYTITEKPAENYNLKTSSNTEGKIEEKTTKDSIFTNAAEGNLAVEKTVSSTDPGDLAHKFKFRIELDDKTINGKFGDMTFVDGVAEIELMNGETDTAEGLPAGTKYTVTELDSEDFTVTATDAEGTISTETSTASFTNSRVNEGQLSVTKNVESTDPDDLNKEFSFKITLGAISGRKGNAEFENNQAIVGPLKKGETATVTGLPDYIHYKITSSPKIVGTYGDMEFSESGVCEYDSNDGTIRFADTIPAGTKFTIKLSVTSSDICNYGDIEFKDGVAEFKLTNGQTKTAIHLPAGIDYTVEETPEDGFTTTYTGNTGKISTDSSAVFTNKRTEEETTEVDVEKVWKDASGKTIAWPDGAKVTVVVKNGEDEVAEYELTKAEPSHKFTKLPKIGDDGQEIKYTVEEKSSTGVPQGKYKVTVSESAAEGFTVTNSEETTEVEVEKVWKDASGKTIAWPDGAKVTVVVKNGDKEVAEYELTKAEPSHKFTNLPKVGDDGKEIKYTVEEKSATGVPQGKYKVTVSGSAAEGFTVTNSEESTSVEVEKVWKDASGKTITWPNGAKVTVVVKNGDKEVAEYELTKAEPSHKFTNLPKIGDDGKEIKYTVEEKSSTGVPQGKYKVTVSGSAAEGFTVTNSEESTSVEVEKVWKDASGKTITWPNGAKVTVVVKNGDKEVAEYELTKAEPSHKFTNLPKIGDDGKEIKYTVEEKSSTGVPQGKYKVTVSGSAAEGFTVTNSEESTSVEVEKVWKDASGKTITWPNGAKVTVAVKNGDKEVAEYELTKAEPSHKFTNLPKIGDDGKEIKYTVEEKSSTGVPQGKYKVTVSGSAAEGFTVTNSEESTSVEVEKVWKDASGKTITWPNGAKVTVVVKNGDKEVAEYELTKAEPSHKFTNLPKIGDDGKEIKYTVEEKSSTGVPQGKYKVTVSGSAAEGFTVTNSEESTSVEVEKVWKDASGKTITWPNGAKVTVAVKNGDKEVAEYELTKAEPSHKFTNLPKIGDDGKEIKYTVEEKSSTGVPQGKYKVTVSGSAAEGFTVTNSEESTSVEVEKVWKDASGKTITWPNGAKVTVVVKNGDKEVAEYELTKAEPSHKFTNLPKIGDDGKEIKYTVEEKSSTGVPQGKYKVTVSGSAAEGFTVTNSEESTSVEVEKVWKDASGKTITWPNGAKVTVAVKNGDKEVAEYELTKAEPSHKFTNLPKVGDDGKEIKYTVEEKSSTGVPKGKYKVTVSGSAAEGFTVTNSEESTSVEVEKVWKDASGKTIAWPEGAKVTVVVKNGEDEVAEYELTKAEPSHKFTNLPKIGDDGQEIEYTVDEKSATGVPQGKYKVTVSGSAAEGFTVTNSEESTSVEVEKVWKDASGKTITWPEGAKVTVVVKNGEDEVAEYTLTSEEQKHKFSNLTKIDDNGEEIKYTVEEKSTTGVPKGKYKVTVSGSAADGYTVTNSEETTSVEVEKVWKDASGKTIAWPEGAKVTVVVKNGEDEVAEYELTKAEPSHKFTNLPKIDDDGQEIKYTVEEKSSTGVPQGKYKVTVSGSAAEGFTVTNSEESTSVEVEKVWKDASGKTITWPDGAKVTVSVKNGDKEVAEYELTKAEPSHKFTNLPKVGDDGKEIKYTVEEKSSTGVPKGKYKVTVSGSAAEGFTVTNSEESTSVEVEKVWKDASGKTIAWPEGAKVTVVVKNGEDEVAEYELTKAEPSHKFSNLPKIDDDGQEIKYTVEEKSSTGVPQGKYKVTVSGSAAEGFTVTNSEESTSVEVEKVWKDASGKTITWPEGAKVTVVVKNGEKEVAEYTLTSEEQKHKFSNLPKIGDDGQEIKYTVEEKSSTGVPEGKYKVTVSGSAAEGFTVTNSENVGSLKIKKEFDGMSSDKLSEAQKSQLKFTVKNSNGDLIESFTYADMDPSGEKTISDLPIGDYIVSETGADTLDVNGYAFNETTFNVEGGKTAVSKDNEAVVIITNKYSYSAKCTGEIKVQKVLQGRAWNDSDQFTFTLSADKGTPMPAETTITIRKSDADFIKSFGEIKFTKAGKYTYTVRETKGNIKGVNYDTKAHKVTIEVVDDGNGNLVARGGTSLIQTVKIINTTGVKTGDENQILLPMAGMLASMLALLLIVIRRRKSRA